MKVKDCRLEVFVEIPDEFATSNEVWPTKALGAVSGAIGDAAVLVGSGNAPNVLPTIDGLERASFIDISPGHADVFKAKLAAARAAGSWAYNLGGSFAGALCAEANLFDLVRGAGDKRHFSHSDQFRDAFVGLADSVFAVDCRLNILDDSKAPSVNEGAERLGWLHLSNVVPYCIERGAKDVERKVFGFIEGLPGIDDETIVTYSTRSDVFLDDLRIRRLVVEAKSLDDLVFNDLENRDRIGYDSDGEVVVRSIA